MKLIGRNIKGSTFEHELAQVTIFTGPNFRGKSTRIETAQLAVAAYVPGVSEKPRDIFDEFSSGARMEVELKCENDVTFRSWEMTKGVVKYNPVVAKTFESFPRVAIDYTEFFGLSGPERAKFLFARAKLPESMTVAAFTRTVTANLKNVKLEENTPATEQVIADLVKYITERQQVAPQDWLANLIVDSKAKLNSAVATAKRMESTLQGMTAVSSETTVSADCEAKAAEARTALDEANKTRTRLQTELDGLRDEWDAANKTASKWFNDTDERQRLKQNEQEKQVEFNACQVELSNLTAAVTKHTTAKEAWSKTINEGLNPHYDRVKELQQQILAAKKPGVCSECGHKTKADPKRVTELKKLLAVEKAREEGLKLAQREACEAMNKAGEDLTAAQTAHDKRALHEKKFRQLAQEHSKLKEKLSQNDAANEAKNKLPGIKTAGEEKKKQLTDATTDANAKATTYDTLALQVQQLNAERGKAQQRALVIEDCAKARAEVAVLRELCKLLTELQAKLLEQVVGPLIANINSYCGDMLRAPLEYREGEIGFVGTQYRHKTMSGTEKTVFYAACSCALAQDAPVRMVLLDEFDIDAINWAKLVALLCDLCATGKLDLALLAHTTAPNITAPNLKVIAL